MATVVQEFHLAFGLSHHSPTKHTPQTLEGNAHTEPAIVYLNKQSKQKTKTKKNQKIKNEMSSAYWHINSRSTASSILDSTHNITIPNTLLCL